MATARRRPRPRAVGLSGDRREQRHHGLGQRRGPLPRLGQRAVRRTGARVGREVHVAGSGVGRDEHADRVQRARHARDRSAAAERLDGEVDRGARRRSQPQWRAVDLVHERRRGQQPPRDDALPARHGHARPSAQRGAAALHRRRRSRRVRQRHAGDRHQGPPRRGRERLAEGTARRRREPPQTGRQHDRGPGQEPPQPERRRDARRLHRPPEGRSHHLRLPPARGSRARAAPTAGSSRASTTPPGRPRASSPPTAAGRGAATSASRRSPARTCARTSRPPSRSPKPACT